MLPARVAPSSLMASNGRRLPPWLAVRLPKGMRDGRCGWWPTQWSSWGIATKHLTHPDRQDPQKNELKPHLNKTWCLGQIDARFIAQLEHLLWLYALPYDRLYPVICFDERPCFLIGEEIDPLPLHSGQVRKEHYAYEKNGSCALLAAIEPLTGKRLAQVHPQPTQKDDTLFLQVPVARDHA